MRTWAKITVSLILLCISAFAQRPIFHAQNVVEVAGATPGFVNETSKNSTLTNTLGTNPSGQTACANNAYCLPYAEPALSGNLGIISFSYSNGSTTTPTTASVADDKSDSYTCLTGSHSGTRWNGLCYFPNLTADAHLVTITLASGLTQVQAKAAQFYNVDTSSPARFTPVSNAGSGTSASVTITQPTANDLIYLHVCAVGLSPGTPMTSFTAGSGYTILTTDIQDGCATEYKIATGSGETAPAMTLSPTESWLAFASVYKSATAGTAPSGLYLTKMSSWSSTSQISGTYNFQFPYAAGHLLVNSNSCGAGLSPTGVTDSSNTWNSAGAMNGSYTNEFYVANSSASSTGLLSVSTSSTGDCTFNFLDFAGAPTAPIVARTLYGGSQTSGVSALPMTILSLPDGASNVGGWQDTPTTGLVIFVGGQGTQTSKGFTAPSSGCAWDGASYGGMPLDGPEPIDENNMWGHCQFSSAPQPVWSITQSSSGTAPGTWQADALAFWGTTGTGVKNWTETEGSAAGSPANFTLTVPSTTSGNLLTVAVGLYNSTARTVSRVCLGTGTITAVGCTGGTAFTQLTSAAGSSGSGQSSDIWYVLSAPASQTVVTVVASGTASNAEAMYDEVQKGTGSWSADGDGSHTGSANGTTATGASITITGAVDFCTAAIAVSTSVTGPVPKSGNEWTYGGLIYNNSTDATASLLTTSGSGSHAPQWNSSSTTNAYSTGCFK